MAARAPFIVICALVLAAGLGCGKGKKSTFGSMSEGEKAAPARPAEPRAAARAEGEEEDEADREWGAPVPAGRARLRLLLTFAGRPLVGRPAYAADQFRHTAYELAEMHVTGGMRATGGRETDEWNVNPRGRHVVDLKPGLWQVKVETTDNSFAPWRSSLIELDAGKAHEIEIDLRKPDPTRPAERDPDWVEVEEEGEGPAASDSEGSPPAGEGEQAGP
jgi:hypothetical protein